MRRLAAIAVLGLVLAGSGCGKYGPPVRPERPTPDEGPIYDAGQPIENGGSR